MRNVRTAFAVFILLLLFSSQAWAETFDAAADYTCDQPSAGVWSFEGYRAVDDKYLPMIFGHAEIRELSKYGSDAHYIPDSDQPNYPFITRFGDVLIASPATKGRRFDAALAWESPGSFDVTVSGHVEVRGNIRGDLTGKKVKVGLLMGGKALWEEVVESGKPAKFEAKSSVAKGDRLIFRIQNTGDESGDLTAFNVHVEAAKK